MYNTQQKMNFFQSKKNMAERLHKSFSRYALFEEEFNKDLSLFTKEELEKAVNSCSAISNSAIEGYFAEIKDYVEWCKLQGLPTSDAIYSVKVSVENQILIRMASSPKDLQSKLNLYFAPPEKESIDLVYRSFLWLAFMGVEYEDTVLISSDCFDFKNGIVKYNDKYFKIYEESIPDLKRACTLTSFSFEHTFIAAQRKDRAPGNIVLRNFTSSNGSLSDIRSCISRKNSSLKQAGKSGISFRSIRLSGIFYRVYQNEMNGKGLSFDEIIYEDFHKREEIREKQGKDSNPNADAVFVSRLKKKYRDDYQNWKSAFNL